MKFSSFAAALTAACLVASAAGAAPEAMPALHYLSEVEANPDRLAAPRPPKDSPELAREMANLRAIIAAASPERLAQADADGNNETPSVFDAATGKTLAKLPATSKLLNAIIEETEAVVERGKRHFAMPRPYQIDPTLPHCGKGKNVLKSYPSGHAGFGYSTGWALAQLMPARAPQILARAQDYAFSREVCGVHFHSDTEASHVIGTVVAERMLADPRLAKTVREARRELAAK